MDVAGGIRAGTVNFEKIAGGRAQDAFGHVAAAGVSRAEADPGSFGAAGKDFQKKMVNRLTKSAAKTTLSAVSGTDFGQTVGVFFDCPAVFGSDFVRSGPIYPH